jgi:hypothetical protein
MSHKRTAPLPSPENSWYSLHGDQQMHHAPFLQETAQVSAREQYNQQAAHQLQGKTKVV